MTPATAATARRQSARLRLAPGVPVERGRSDFPGSRRDWSRVYGDCARPHSPLFACGGHLFSCAHDEPRTVASILSPLGGAYCVSAARPAPLDKQWGKEVVGRGSWGGSLTTASDAEATGWAPALHTRIQKKVKEKEQKNSLS